MSSWWTSAGEQPISVFLRSSPSRTPTFRLFSASRSATIFFSGGDNLDLSLAHFLEGKLAPGSQLPPSTFAQLLARCRDIKEDALACELGEDEVWPVAVSKPGSSILTGTLRCEVSSKEVAQLLLEGFFPPTTSGEQPLRAAPGLREMGLPYAKDPAVTRHLSDFLRGRPPVDFILFNGGVTKSPAIRQRILENISRWQPGHVPAILENTDPDLAVARGAARFLHLRASGDTSRIEAGASHAYYVRLSETSALCLLPQGAHADQEVTVAHTDLRALVGRSVSFDLLRNARRSSDMPGDIVSTADEGFSVLPSVETILAPPAGSRAPSGGEFALRFAPRSVPRDFSGSSFCVLNRDSAGMRHGRWIFFFGEVPHLHQTDPPTPRIPVTRAGAQLVALLDPSRKTRQKLTANAVFSSRRESFGAAEGQLDRRYREAVI
jgi:hypothetical protein